MARSSTKPRPPEIELSLEMLRPVARWAAQCAERVLPLFELHVSPDRRPREAVEAIALFARDGKRTARLRSCALAALSAAREVDDPAASAAARAAGVAAALPYMHPIAGANHAKHVLGPATYAALASELAADGDRRVGDAEIGRAIEQAPAELREIMRQMPVREAGRGRVNELMHQLDAGLRDP